MGNDTEADVPRITKEESEIIARHVNRVTIAITDAANASSLRDVPHGAKLFGGATALAAMIRSYVPEEEWPEAVRALSDLIRTVLSSEFRDNADGSVTLAPRKMQ